MPELVNSIATWCAAAIELVGVVIITLAGMYALGLGAYRRLWHAQSDPLEDIRQHLGRGILLGLEFFVAADVIRTVAVELTFETVGVLVILVLIRTFLSAALHAELNGLWPWRRP